MSLENLKQLETSLWEAADTLRANSRLNATEYSMPVLGLIFLRHATNRFEVVEAEVKGALPTRGGQTRAVTKDDFKNRAALFLPPEARYGHLAALPESENLGGAVDHAMKRIEEENPSLSGVLPREFSRFEKKTLGNLIAIFNRDELRTAQGDVFGRIYEYFLNKFASSAAQEEGAFFTPPSLVRLIVNVIEPNHGQVLDPAVGSAGMLVQSAHFIEALEQNPGEVATFIGQEKSEATIKLAKMNVAVHGFEAAIHEGNSYYNPLEEHIGRCDFVMANPPFNVDGVDIALVKDDKRLWTKKRIPDALDKKGNAKSETVGNANYLWIQYFYAYLNKTGRAGFVMAASATDAGHGEQEIRREIVQTGDVDVIIRIGEKFFYTRSLPCTLWFFERGRGPERAGKTLMLDARNIFRVVSRKVHDFSEEQLANLTAVVWLYRGQGERFLGLVGHYLDEVDAALDAVPAAVQGLDAPLAKLNGMLKDWRAKLNGRKGLDEAAVVSLDAVLAEGVGLATHRGFPLGPRAPSPAPGRLNSAEKAGEGARGPSRTPDTNASQHTAYSTRAEHLPNLRLLQKHINETHKLTERALDLVEKSLGGRADAGWDNREARTQRKALDEARHGAIEAIRRVLYFMQQVHWLQSRFPDAVFVPVPGLCRVVDVGEIEAQDWSLTPGRFVGTAPAEVDEEEDIEERLRAIHQELAGLNEEAAELAGRIAANFEELVG
jgi:type I restriction enzyme M protein